MLVRSGLDDGRAEASVVQWSATLARAGLDNGGAETSGCIVGSSVVEQGVRAVEQGRVGAMDASLARVWSSRDCRAVEQGRVGVVDVSLPRAWSSKACCAVEQGRVGASLAHARSSGGYLGARLCVVVERDRRWHRIGQADRCYGRVAVWTGDAGPSDVGGRVAAWVG